MVIINQLFLWMLLRTVILVNQNLWNTINHHGFGSKMEEKIYLDFRQKLSGFLKKQKQIKIKIYYSIHPEKSDLKLKSDLIIDQSNKVSIFKNSLHLCWHPSLHFGL